MFTPRSIRPGSGCRKLMSQLGKVYQDLSGGKRRPTQMMRQQVPQQQLALELGLRVDIFTALHVEQGFAGHYRRVFMAAGFAYARLDMERGEYIDPQTQF